MQTVLLVIHVIIALSLIGMILIQRSDSDGFGLGSGSGSNFMTGRSAANFLTRTTAILATLFIVNSLVLGIMAARHTSGSIVDTIEQQQGDALPATPEQVIEATEDGPAPKTDASQARKEQPAKKAVREQKNEPAVPTE